MAHELSHVISGNAVFNGMMHDNAEVNAIKDANTIMRQIAIMLGNANDSGERNSHEAAVPYHKIKSSNLKW